jgi:hypothetical protein
MRKSIPSIFWSDRQCLPRASSVLPEGLVPIEYIRQDHPPPLLNVTSVQLTSQARLPTYRHHLHLARACRIPADYWSTMFVMPCSSEVTMAQSLAAVARGSTNQGKLHWTLPLLNWDAALASFFGLSRTLHSIHLTDRHSELMTPNPAATHSNFSNILPLCQIPASSA